MSLIKWLLQFCLITIAVVLLTSRFCELRTRPASREWNPIQTLMSSWTALTKGVATIAEAKESLQKSPGSTNDSGRASFSPKTETSNTLPTTAHVPNPAVLLPHPSAPSDLDASPVSAPVRFEVLLKKVQAAREQLISDR